MVLKARGGPSLLSVWSAGAPLGFNLRREFYAAAPWGMGPESHISVPLQTTGAKDSFHWLGNWKGSGEQSLLAGREGLVQQGVKQGLHPSLWGLHYRELECPQFVGWLVFSYSYLFFTYCLRCIHTPFLNRSQGLAFGGRLPEARAGRMEPKLLCVPEIPRWSLPG